MNGVQNRTDRWMIQMEYWMVKGFVRYLPPLAYNQLRNLKQRWGDRTEGINTAGDLEYPELGFNQEIGNPYNPGGWWDLKATLGHNVTPEDVFIDFGSGKGRMVYLAARDYPFKRVIGIEITEKLNRIARQNIQHKLPQLRCRQIELVTANVLEYEVPDDITVIYMFNPFIGDVFTGLFSRVRQSLERRPRQIRLIYRTPEMHDYLTKNGFRIALKLEDLNMYIAGEL